MFELTIRDHFDAAHFLKNYQGKCAKIHGHTWEVEVKIQGKELDQIGMMVDFSILKKNLKEIVEKLDHILINDLLHFQETNPTAENISAYIGNELAGLIKTYPVKLFSVTVWESPRAAATYYPGL